MQAPLPITKRLTREGVGIEYSVAGRKNTGPTVVAVHGFCLSKESFGGIAPFTEGLRVISVDLRGHGGTEIGDSTKKTYFRDCARDVKAVMDKEGITEAIVFGSSMGGLVTINLAEELQGRRVKLLLECPVLTDPFTSLPEGGLSNLIRFGGAAAIKAIKSANGSGDLLIDLIAGEVGFALAFLATRAGSNYKPSGKELRVMWDHLFHVTKTGVITAYEAMREEGEGVGRRLSAINVPVFLIGSTTDPFVDWKYLYKRFAEDLDGGTPFKTRHGFHKVMLGGHLPHLEMRNDFRVILRAALNGDLF